jgi:hypothetical protein
MSARSVRPLLGRLASGYPDQYRKADQPSMRGFIRSLADKFFRTRAPSSMAAILPFGPSSCSAPRPFGPRAARVTVSRWRPRDDTADSRRMTSRSTNGAGTPLSRRCPRGWGRKRQTGKPRTAAPLDCRPLRCNHQRPDLSKRRRRIVLDEVHTGPPVSGGSTPESRDFCPRQFDSPVMLLLAHCW